YRGFESLSLRHFLLDGAELPLSHHPGKHAEDRGHHGEKPIERGVAVRSLALRGIGNRGRAGKRGDGSAEANEAEGGAEPDGELGADFHGGQSTKKTPEDPFRP